MIRPHDLPQTVWRVLRRETNYGAPYAGWFAPNQAAPRHCLPTYRLPGGGVQQQDLTDLPEAIEQSIHTLQVRKAECDRLILVLQEVQDELGDRK